MDCKIEDLEKVSTENPEVLANLITYAEEMYDKDDEIAKALIEKARELIEEYTSFRNYRYRRSGKKFIDR